VFHTCTLFFSCQFQSGWNLRTCMVSMLIISDLSYPYPFAVLYVLEGKEVSCRAFLGEGHFSLHHRPWSQEWTCTPSGDKGSQRANAEHKNHQSVQIGLQGRDILEHNARLLSLCSLVETVFRIHWHLIICLISLLFRIAILVLCGGCHRNGCLILI